MAPKKQRRLTKREEDLMLVRFYAELEIETDKAVVLGEFIGYHEEVDLNHEESNTSKDEENEMAETNDCANNIPPVADDTDETHEEPTEEEVLPHKQKFGSLTDALDKSKYVDLPPQKPKTYMYANAMKTMTVKRKTVKNDDSLGANTTPATNILKHKPGPRKVARRVWTPLDSFELYLQMKCLKRT